MADLAFIVPPRDLHDDGRLVVFHYISCRLASHRNAAYLFAETERILTPSEDHIQAYKTELDHWVQELHREVWVACQEPGGGNQSPIKQSIYHI